MTSQHTLESDIERDWAIVKYIASNVLDVFESKGVESEKEIVVESDEKVPISVAGQKRREGLRRKEYGMSLILSNVPMSPKFINGSFAALFDTNDFKVEFARDLERGSIDFNVRPLRLSPRKRLKDHSKQYSLDLCLAPPASRRGIRTPKQGSLDSKIEEIFDSSFESDVYEGDSEVSIEVNGDEAPAAGENESEAERSEPEDAKASQPISIPYHNRKVGFLDVANDGSNDEDTSSTLKKNSGLQVNGIHNLRCKHCGKPFED